MTMKMAKDSENNMDKFRWIFILLVSLSARAGLAFNLPESSLPVSIQNGSSEGLIIDCPYELEENDSNGLVVKWYYSNKPIPVYQWIPRSKPQDIGRLKGRLDMSFEVSSDPYTKYRALSIKEPTTDLSGKYYCWVSNFNQEMKMEVALTVYTPATYFSFTHEKINADSVVLTCSAEGLFPTPKLALYRMNPTAGTYHLEGEHQEVFMENGTWSVSLEIEFDHQFLEQDNDFLCSLTIPNTEYQFSKEMYYNPAGTGSDVSRSEPTLFLLALLSLLTGNMIFNS